jgi:hypothetical protein
MPELADTIGTLDGEILVAKIQLDRALAEWQRWQVGNVDANDLLDTECGSSSATGSGETVVHSQKDEMQLRRPDLHALIDRCLSRIGRLQQQQAKIKDEDEDLSKDHRKGGAGVPRSSRRDG